MCAMLVKAETRAAEVEGPYGTDGQTHSPLNPTDLLLCLTLSPLINPYILPRLMVGLLFTMNNS